MIHSMTAYARKQFKGDWGSAVWEIRSVNQRYLETYIRAPEQFRGLEPVIREKLRKRMQRGKLEVNLRFEAAQNNAAELQINQALASQIIEHAQWVMEECGRGQLNPIDVLRWPGVMEAPEQDVDALSKELLAALDTTINEFLEARASEGANLKVFIEQRLEEISSQAAFVRTKMPEVMAWQRERLSNRLAEAQVELEPARLEQEMVMLAQKVDVAEELDRLDSHISETRNILKKGGAIGRRLDFMMQEFNREANTLASKSINAEITNASVECKVLIEQMREQIQNIE
ncbi:MULTISPECIES: YicC/YloC family endoribonuclease [unclassified Motilimonas]|uniref:YicC/YloC family endoribonuclease n=1 Tax=unclassified Motilimonas TaxID=2643697 RepID=UPI001E6399B2|nr:MULTISPECIES: YicC/YloC family endoribonuclease [unclassified Motilimonas]MCE0557314.1 YicC family protein [Motilimonas sp. E26]MDO6528113.1 YicC/YloC family endoribonuclease [Motilimonas sp. 1_MG-2023]